MCACTHSCVYAQAYMAGMCVCHLILLFLEEKVFALYVSAANWMINICTKLNDCLTVTEFETNVGAHAQLICHCSWVWIFLILLGSVCVCVCVCVSSDLVVFIKFGWWILSLCVAEAISVVCFIDFCKYVSWCFTPSQLVWLYQGDDFCKLYANCKKPGTSQ